MKTLNRSDIIKEVRIKLDEIGINESEMIETLEDNTNLDCVIQSYINHAYDFVMMNADISLLNSKDGSSIPISIGSDTVATLKLPDDFLRLINIRLSSWRSSMSSLITEDSSEYRMQSNKWLSGNPECPVVAIVHKPDGRYLELYKAALDSDGLSVFTYIPTIDESNESVSIPKQLTDAFICYIAALTLVTFREEHANGFFSLANNILGIQ